MPITKQTKCEKCGNLVSGFISDSLTNYQDWCNNCYGAQLIIEKKGKV